MRPLVVLGPCYVRESLDRPFARRACYDELARQRTRDGEEADVATYRRLNMRRLAAADKS